MKEVSRSLQAFVKKRRWEYEFPLTKDVRLYEDLGIYGDDVDEFFAAFGEEFNVDLSEFMAADYFKDEGVDFLELLVGLLRRGKPGSIRRKTLTLGHLEQAISAGRLNEDIITAGVGSQSS